MISAAEIWTPYSFSIRDSRGSGKEILDFFINGSDAVNTASDIVNPGSGLFVISLAVHLRPVERESEPGNGRART